MSNHQERREKSEIYESTQYHWNKKCYTFTDTDCDFGCALHWNISTFLQFQTWGWWPPPSVDSKANGTWPFLRVRCHGTRMLQVKQFYLRIQYYSTYDIDDEPQILLLYSCRQPQHHHNSDFYIVEFLGLMAAIPRRTQSHRWSQACGRQRHRPPTRCPSLLTDSTSCYYRLGAVWCCFYHILQDDSTHTTRGSCREPQADYIERMGSASFWHRPRTQPAVWSGP